MSDKNDVFVERVAGIYLLIVLVALSFSLVCICTQTAKAAIINIIIALSGAAIILVVPLSWRKDK